MLDVKINENDKNQIAHERYHHTHPHIRRKMDVLHLKNLGLPHHLISDIAGVTGNTMRTYFREYLSGGLDKIREVNFYRPESDLQKHEETIKKYFDSHPPATLKEAAAAIESLTGIKRSLTQIGIFLKKKSGFKLRKVGFIPGKGNEPEKELERKEFVDTKLEPRIKLAKEGKIKLFFGDAAHFVYGNFVGYLWCLVRLFIPSATGRERFNVLGALDAITKEVTTVTNETYVNSKVFCELLLKLHQKNFGVPITLVLDNARYQKCKLVTELADFFKIELLYLPSYSPQLNIIERLWKWIKKDALYCKWYPNFDAFKQAIENSLGKTKNPLYKPELESLLSLKFQSFEKAKIVTL